MYFLYFVIISLQKAWPIRWINLNPFTKQCVMPSSLKSAKFFLSRSFFFHSVNVSSLFRRNIISLVNRLWLWFEQILIWCVAPNLVVIDQGIHEKMCFEFHKCMFAISLSSTNKQRWPSLKQTWILFAQGGSVLCAFKICWGVWRKDLFF